MHIIASSKNNTPGLSKGMKRGYGIIGVIIVLICIAIFIASGSPASFLLLLLYAGLLGTTIRRSHQNPGAFVAYINGLLLRIDYEVEEGNGSTVMKKFEVPLSSVKGYTRHSFLKMGPALIEIEFGNEYGRGKSRPITIENLSAAEQQKLFSFLDGIIVKTRRIG